jgi:MoaA/NifB/PqqE/SkfB family radical SAM enzyme/GT2 family glycosyltransferase
MFPAKTPRILWVELTSKCPFDCIFCSRKTRRGGGEHMPFALFESLVKQVSDPRTFLLNYSGESTVYPDLIPAIRLARSTGAAVELVSALAGAPEPLVDELSAAGLSRLTVSVHAAGAAAFAEIYRHSSFAALRTRLERLVKNRNGAMAIDLAFVAMERNLGELRGVAELARELGLPAVNIFPVIRRDAIPMVFAHELTGSGSHREEFREQLTRLVGELQQRFPQIAFAICNPLFQSAGQEFGESPRPCPGELPAGARIYSCEQNPWETAHVLSNGDVVACEVHDRSPLGNLTRQTLAEIWHGEAYREFRRHYHTGGLAACRSCPWKTAYAPAPLCNEILAERGRNAQLGHGWHAPADESHIWSSQQAAAVIEPRPGSSELHINGILPPGLSHQRNELYIRCNGEAIGTIANPSAEMLHFGVDLPVPRSSPRPWNLELRTRFAYRPRDRGESADQRDLGFALRTISSQPAIDISQAVRGRAAIGPLRAAVREADRIGRILNARVGRRSAVVAVRTWEPGLSIVIPERNTIPELGSCLAGIRAATRGWDEPLETLVIVNGAPAGLYRELQFRYPGVRWQFHSRPLGFSGAVQAGVSGARHAWTYLLNSDAIPDVDAFKTARGHRDPTVFSIASQILLADTTRFRDETNLTRLFVEDGLAASHDLIPQSGNTIEHFYAGGGASLFQTRLLRQFLTRAYDPFYWEDVEWGWRARKLGYRSLFCADSVVHHKQRTTISRHYSQATIESICERNRLLFQLRNFTSAGSIEAVAEAVARAGPETVHFFNRWRVIGGIARARIWNHLATVSDEEVLDGSYANAGDTFFQTRVAAATGSYPGRSNTSTLTSATAGPR